MNSSGSSSSSGGVTGCSRGGDGGGNSNISVGGVIPILVSGLALLVVVNSNVDIL